MRVPADWSEAVATFHRCYGFVILTCQKSRRAYQFPDRPFYFTLSAATDRILCTMRLVPRRKPLFQARNGVSFDNAPCGGIIHRFTTASSVCCFTETGRYSLEPSMPIWSIFSSPMVICPSGSFSPRRPSSRMLASTCMDRLICAASLAIAVAADGSICLLFTLSMHSISVSRISPVFVPTCDLPQKFPGQSGELVGFLLHPPGDSDQRPAPGAKHDPGLSHPVLIVQEGPTVQVIAFPNLAHPAHVTATIAGVDGAVEGVLRVEALPQLPILEVTSSQP